MKLVDIKTASAELGISEFSLRKGARQGRFPFVRITGGGTRRYLFDVDRCEEVLRAEMEESRQEAQACRR